MYIRLIVYIPFVSRSSSSSITKKKDLHVCQFAFVILSWLAKVASAAASPKAKEEVVNSVFGFSAVHLSRMMPTVYYRLEINLICYNFLLFLFNFLLL